MPAEADANEGGRRRSVVRGGLALAAVVGACGLGGWLLHEDLPTGPPGARADALAARVEAAVDRDAWERTGAVRWTFFGHAHLWDRERELHRVRWDGKEVLLRFADRGGRAWVDGVEVTGERRRALLDDAHAFWINDSFWLNPLVKLFDEGVTRRIVTEANGSEALLVTYAAGGRTPGDSYLWRVGDDGLPTAWKMWVSVLPIGGVEVSWEAYRTLGSGARVATLHRGGPFAFEITDVAGEATLRELVGTDPDPFAPIVEEELAATARAPGSPGSPLPGR